MEKYDYHQDSEIAQLAEKYDCVHPSVFRCVEEGLIDVPLPLYNIDILLVNFNNITKGKYVFDNPYECFKTVLTCLFVKYNKSDSCTTRQIETWAKGLITTLYKDFITRLDTLYNCNFSEEYPWIKKWRDVTIEGIKEVFERYPFSLTMWGDSENNYGLLQQSLRVTYFLYDDFLRSLKYGPMVEASQIVLYNFWGDDYFLRISDVRKKYAKTNIDLQMEQHVCNLGLFQETFGNLISRAISDAVPENYGCEIRQLIYKLFPAYIELLRDSNITDPNVYSFCAEHWCDVTLTMMQNEIYLNAQPLRLFDYQAGSIVHRKIFRSSQRDKWEALEKLAEQIDDIILSAKYPFVEELTRGHIKYPWHQQLKELGIKYNELYKVLCPNYISGIKPDYLKHCFESANLSGLQERCCKANEGYGVLRFVAIAIGKKCDKWRDTAASSLTDSNGKMYDWRSLDKSISSKKEFVRKFINEVQEYDTGLSYDWL